MEIAGVLVSFLMILGSAHCLTLGGPYYARLVDWRKCDNSINDTLKFDLQIHATATGKRYFNGVITLPVDMDDKLQGEIKAKEWSSRSGWMEGALNVKTKNLCKFIKKLAPGYFKSFTTAINVPEKCPVPKGTYNVSNWIVGLKFGLPELLYGLFSIDVEYLYNDDRKRLGCVRWILEVSRKIRTSTRG